ncbi:MAG: hypothetical protein ACJ75H_02180 [Thermoanaerobaculia bacterium]
MALRATINFHLPLTPELHDQLREEAAATGQPATVVAREALQAALDQRRRRRLYVEIASFASAHAGTDLDLDEDLEHAGIRSAIDLGS